MKLLSASSYKGKRDYMEDRGAYISENGVTVGMVCDGHGGKALSDKTANQLPRVLLQQPMNGIPIQNAVTLRNAILDYGNQNTSARSGTTLTGIIEPGDGFVYVYNVGDSRTSLHMNPGSLVSWLRPVYNENGELTEEIKVHSFSTPFFTTFDHDATSEIEKARIGSSKGELMGKRLNGILSVTRSFGDAGVGPGLDYTPDIFWVKKESLNGPILMYSDGVYEAIRDNQSMDTKHMIYHLAEKHGTNELVGYCYHNGSTDNITAMMLTK